MICDALRLSCDRKTTIAAEIPDDSVLTLPQGAHVLSRYERILARPEANSLLDKCSGIVDSIGEEPLDGVHLRISPRG